MDWLRTLGGETRTRLMGLVRGGPRSIGELAGALGISDNAVRGHVAALERDGLVRLAGTDRSTGGKPARLYELTPAAEELYPKAYALVLSGLVEAVREEEGEAAVVALLRRVGRRLGARAGGPTAEAPAPKSPASRPPSAVEPGSGARDGAERVAAAAALLNSLGGAVEVWAGPEGWALESEGCPLSRVVAESPVVCALAESLVGEVTGRRVEERCRKGRRPRCTFIIVDEPAAGSAGG